MFPFNFQLYGKKNLAFLIEMSACVMPVFPGSYGRLLCPFLSQEGQVESQTNQILINSGFVRLHNKKIIDLKTALIEI